MADAPGPEFKAALMKGAIAEAVLIAAGAAAFLGTGEIAWLIGAVIAGGAIMVLLLMQAGAFGKR